jgi:hypothetical protein
MPRRLVSRAPSARAATPRLSPPKPYSRGSPFSPHRSPLASSARTPLSPWSNAHAGGSPQTQVAEESAPPPSPVLDSRPDSPIEFMDLESLSSSVIDYDYNTDALHSQGQLDVVLTAQSDDDSEPDSQTRLDALMELSNTLRTLAAHLPRLPGRYLLVVPKTISPYTSRVSSPDPEVPDLDDFAWDYRDWFSPRPYGSPPSVGSIVSALDADCPSPKLESVDSNDDRDFYENLLDDENFTTRERKDPNQHLDEQPDLPKPRPTPSPEPEAEPEPEPEHEHEPEQDQDYFGPLNDVEPDPDDPEPDDEYPCGAFDEDPPDFRNFFIRTWIKSAYRGATNEMICDDLATQKDWLLELQRRGELSDALSARLLFFPLTLRALERRLGMDVNSLITIYSLCPKCGVRRTIDYINNARDPECPRVVGGEVCGGILYTTSRLYNGKIKHTPTRSYPRISISDSLERQLLRPGFAEVLQKWRLPGNNEGDFPPTRRLDWMDEMPLDRSFGKSWEGWGWRNYAVGLDRGYNEETGIYGDRPNDGFKSLVRLPLGISISINIDG